MTMNRRMQGIAVSMALALGLASGSSAAQTKKECASAYVEAQKLKQGGAFKKAREQLIVCSKKDCLAAARKDCLAWLDEVNASIPSIVVEAKDPSGQDTFDVKVSIGGEVLVDKLSVNAIELDPGTHTLVFEYPGADPIEREVVLRQGQKNTAVSVSFAPDAPAEEPEPAATESAEVEADLVPTEPSSDGPPVIAYVLGGVGVVALGAAGYFWLSASSAESDLEDSGCEPNCADDDVDSIEQKRLFGDIALGVGVVSLGVAAYFLFTPQKKKSPPPADAARFDVRALPGGAFAGVSGRF